MVEPLKKEDIINIREYKQGKSLVEVSRIKELLFELREKLTTGMQYEDILKIYHRFDKFSVLFDSQSPNQCKPSREAVKDNPPQVIQHESQSAEKSVGVSYSTPKEIILMGEKFIECSECSHSIRRVICFDKEEIKDGFCGGCGRKIKWEEK